VDISSYDGVATLVSHTVWIFEPRTPSEASNRFSYQKKGEVLSFHPLPSISKLVDRSQQVYWVNSGLLTRSPPVPHIRTRSSPAPHTWTRSPLSLTHGPGAPLPLTHGPGAPLPLTHGPGAPCPSHTDQELPLPLTHGP
jgi:hypothetical protein